MNYPQIDISRALQTFQSILETIEQLMDWNNCVNTVDDYYLTPNGMQLLAANCTLITAIGEGVNRINRILPEFLPEYFPNIPWRAIVGMRNHIAHGYFELDAYMVFEAVKTDIPPLFSVIQEAIKLLKSC